MTDHAISLFQVFSHVLRVSGFDVILLRAGPDNLQSGIFTKAAGDFVIEMRPAPGVGVLAEIVIIRLAGQEVFRATITREGAGVERPDSVLAIWGSHQHWRAAFVGLPMNGRPS